MNKIELILPISKWDDVLTLCQEHGWLLAQGKSSRKSHLEGYLLK